MTVYAEVPEWPNGIGLGISRYYERKQWDEDTYWLSAYAGNCQATACNLQSNPVLRIFFKMIEFIVGIILVLFYAYLAYTFTSATSLILNIIVVTALFFLIKKDLKDEDNHKYYITSLLITALFFIFSSTMPIESFLKLTQKLLLSVVSVAALMAYLFAQLTGLDRKSVV